MNIMEIKNLSFSFGKKKILENINLNISQNEKVAIVGPNGCGKTTLLRLMSGYLTPTEGEIKLKNKELKKYSPNEKAKEIAILHQNSKTAFDFTVHDIVKMGRYPYISWNGNLQKTDKTIVENEMKKMDVWQFKSDSINEISGGEKARSLIARTFTQSTDIILMDEPVSAMDLKQEIHLMNIIKNDDKKTYVVVLHDLNLASQFFEKIVLMNDKKIVEIGSPENVITNDNIKKVYEVDVEIITKNNRPYIIPYK